jgi:hypothetical protein
MANKTALVQYSGQWGQIQSGDTLVAPSISTGTFDASSTSTFNSGTGSNFTVSASLGVGVDHVFQLGAAADTFKFGYLGTYSLTITPSDVTMTVPCHPARTSSPPQVRWS